MAEKQRIEYIDLAKGICICLVVWNHITEGGTLIQSCLDDMIFSFRMPLYFFLSGLFFKAYGGFLDFSVRKVNKLIIPLLSFHFISVVFFFLENCLTKCSFTKDNIIEHILVLFFSPYYERFLNPPIWFLLCLFIVNILFYACVSVTRRLLYNIVSLFLVTIVIGIFGYYWGATGRWFPFYVDSAMTALPFFTIGYVFRKYTSILSPNSFDKYNVVLAAVCVIMSFLLARGKTYYSFNNYELNIVQLYLSGLCGIMAVLFMSKQITRLPGISYFGRYSIIILVTHFFLFPYVRRGVDLLALSIIPTLLITFVLTMLCYLGIIPVFIKYLPYITAQKDLIKVS